MIDKQSIRSIIQETMKRVNETRIAYDRLIEFTFLFRGGMSVLSNRDIPNPTYGFMAMTADEIKEVIRGYILPRQNAVDAIKNITSIDLRTYYDDPKNMERFVWACEHNIAFQILITYYFFFYRGYTNIPSTTVEIASAFKQAFRVDSDVNEMTHVYREYRSV